MAHIKRQGLLILAKNMRKNPTDAESILWYQLRGNRFCGYKFKRQVVIGSYIVDFLAAAQKLVIETDGGQHSDIIHKAKDITRTEYLESQGYRVLRFWNNEILNETNAVLESIYNELQRPHPIPPPNAVIKQNKHK